MPSSGNGCLCNSRISPLGPKRVIVFVVKRTSPLLRFCRNDHAAYYHDRHCARQNMMKLCGGVIRAVYASGLSDAVTADRYIYNGRKKINDAHPV